jgi:hypothetical protein
LVAAELLAHAAGNIAATAQAVFNIPGFRRKKIHIRIIKCLAKILYELIRIILSYWLQAA